MKIILKNTATVEMKITQKYKNCNNYNDQPEIFVAAKRWISSITALSVKNS